MAVKDANVGLVAVIGLTTVEIIKLWQSVAPTMEQVRSAPPGDAVIAQRMLDANYLGVALAAVIGGTTSILLQSWLPILMSVGSVSLFAEWHRQVLLSDNTVMERE